MLSLTAFALGGAALPGIAAAQVAAPAPVPAPALAPALATAPGEEIVGLDAVTLRGLIRSRKLSCVEVMNAHLDRIEALNPQGQCHRRAAGPRRTGPTGAGLRCGAGQ